MKKLLPEATDSKNLEEKFDQGEEVLDYFEARRAQVIPPPKSRENPRKRESEKTAVVREDVTAWSEHGQKSSVGSVKGRAQTEPKNRRLDQARRNPGSPKKGQFMDVKSDGKKFKGVAKEPDKRRR